MKKKNLHSYSGTENYLPKDFAALYQFERNASNSECFEHIGWNKHVRIGKCKITGKDVRVDPILFGECSGQPQECFDHFKLRKQYADLLGEEYIANDEREWQKYAKN